MEHQVIEIHAAEEDESTSSHSSVASLDPAKPELGSKKHHLREAGSMQEVDSVAKAEGEGSRTKLRSDQKLQNPRKASSNTKLTPDHWKANETPQQHQAYIGRGTAKGKEKQKQEAPRYDIQKVSLDDSVNHMVRRLMERPPSLRGGNTSSICVFKFPNSLAGISDKSQVPEIVSIGPYHRGKQHLLNFEEHKWSFLEKVLRRQGGSTKQALSYYLEEMRGIEGHTRECYADAAVMSSPDFVEMMLLDGLFVIELFCHLGRSEDVSSDYGLIFSSLGNEDVLINDNDLIFSRPWLIPILIRDLLKLENQLPLFFLQHLFRLLKNTSNINEPLDFLALSVFELAFPRTDDVKSFIDGGRVEGAKHLLDLFYLTLLPPVSQELDNRPSSHSLQSVTRLRPSGIKFKSSDTSSFLDVKFQNPSNYLAVKFQNPVLEIPKITMNDFFGSLLINCLAWEQCLEKSRNYFNDYVSFMSCLINEPRDVAFLYADGVFAAHSKDDQFVANLFNTLGKNVVFNNRNSYLSTQVTDIEAYYSSNLAYIMRTYFSSPWSLISVAYASLLLLFTMLQVFIALWSYLQPLPQPVPK